ncbi:hypothetical protein HDU96_003175 [Phlyctochytrium bullatum]|nr:hypothetical protein HDU96_003175 [Phlyctochytrium bullatum]
MHELRDNGGSRYPPQNGYQNDSGSYGGRGDGGYARGGGDNGYRPRGDAYARNDGHRQDGYSRGGPGDGYNQGGDGYSRGASRPDNGYRGGYERDQDRSGGYRPNNQQRGQYADNDGGYGARRQYNDDGYNQQRQQRDQYRENDRGGYRERRDENGGYDQSGGRGGYSRVAPASPPSAMTTGGNYRSRDVGRPTEPKSPTSPPPSRGNDMNSFFQEIESLQRGVDRCERNVARIRQLQAAYLNASSSSESQRINGELDSLNSDTGDKLQALRSRLKALSNATKQMPQSAETHSRRGQQSTMAQKLMDVARSFQQAQADFKAKTKQKMEREIRIGMLNVVRAAYLSKLGQTLLQLKSSAPLRMVAALRINFYHLAWLINAKS